MWSCARQMSVVEYYTKFFRGTTDQSTELKMSYQAKFLEVSEKSDILKFGSFVLKSGRQSPYFFNLGLFNTGGLLSVLADSYASAIIEHNIDFEILFGPAYKGIPLAAVVITKLAEKDPKYANIEYAFNRKEKKDHGEGGSIVGGQLCCKKVLVIDDVITAGTAIKEAFEIIKAEKGEPVACITALDRQETMKDSDLSPGQYIQQTSGVKVYSIVTLDDVIKHFEDKLSPEQLQAIEEYRKEYSPKN